MQSGTKSVRRLAWSGMTASPPLFLLFPFIRTLSQPLSPAKTGQGFLRLQKRGGATGVRASRRRDPRTCVRSWTFCPRPPSAARSRRGRPARPPPKQLPPARPSGRYPPPLLDPRRPPVRRDVARGARMRRSARFPVPRPPPPDGLEWAGPVVLEAARP